MHNKATSLLFIATFKLTTVKNSLIAQFLTWNSFMQKLPCSKNLMTSFLPLPARIWWTARAKYVAIYHQTQNVSLKFFSQLKLLLIRFRGSLWVKYKKYITIYKFQMFIEQLVQTFMCGIFVWVKLDITIVGDFKIPVQ